MHAITVATLHREIKAEIYTKKSWITNISVITDGK